MLRILVGSLLSGTLLTGPVAASSFLVPSETQDRYGPSFLVMDDRHEIVPPVDPTVTAAYADGDEPRVITAPRVISISPSVSVLLPADAREASASIAAVGAPPSAATPVEQLSQRARQLQPMVIRGGIVGDPFVASAPAANPASGPAREQPAEHSAASTPPPSARSQSSQPSRGPASPSATTPSRPVYNEPAAPPTGLPM